MLYVLHGTDRRKIVASGRKLIDSLLKKKKDAISFRLDDESFSEEALLEFIGSAGLFEKKYVVHLDQVLAGVGCDFLLKNFEQVADSENIFIITEGKLDAKTKKTIEKHAHKVGVYDVVKKPIKRFGTESSVAGDFNIFNISDALGNRNRILLWGLYQEALKSGLPAEDVYSILLWQARVLLSVINTKDTKTLELKPFVLNKAKRFAKNYSPDELTKLSSDLVGLYHNTRRGIVDFEVGLERILLDV
jgi:DNA polymerase III delta subunit